MRADKFISTQIQFWHFICPTKTDLIWVLFILPAGSAIPLQHVDHHAGQVVPVTQADRHWDDGEDGHDQRHEAHHEASSADVDTAAASLEAGHGDVWRLDCNMETKLFETYKLNELVGTLVIGFSIVVWKYFFEQ